MSIRVRLLAIALRIWTLALASSLVLHEDLLNVLSEHQKLLSLSRKLVTCETIVRELGQYLDPLENYKSFQTLMFPNPRLPFIEALDMLRHNQPASRSPAASISALKACRASIS